VTNITLKDRYLIRIPCSTRAKVSVVRPFFESICAYKTDSIGVNGTMSRGQMSQEILVGFKRNVTCCTFQRAYFRYSLAPRLRCGCSVCIAGTVFRKLSGVSRNKIRVKSLQES